MEIIKRLILKIIAFIFTIIITIKYYFSIIILLFIGRLPLKVSQNLKVIKFVKFESNKYDQKLNIRQQNNEKTKNKQKINKLQYCFQNIIDTCISLCLTTSLVNYNLILMKGTLIVSHHVHHSFISLIYPSIPDYTKFIQQSYSTFIIWGFIVFGFMGITTQLAFIIDLINILTLPTKLIYKILRWIYSKCINMIGKLYQFVTKNQRKWITCPYPKNIINNNYRTIALILLIILSQITILTIFYYSWLCLIILAIVIIENFLLNLYILFSHCGYYFVIFKKKKFIQKLRKNRQIFQVNKNQYVKLIQPQKIINIVKGVDIFNKIRKPTEIIKHHKSFSVKQIFRIISSIQ